MERTEARTLALALMSEHGLPEQGWTFRFDNAQSRLGVCRHTVKEISISRHFTAAADRETVRQTMLHEIAHALVGVIRTPSGRRDIHGEAWKRKAASIGYTGKRCADNPHTARESGARLGAPDVPTLERRPAKGDLVVLVRGQRSLVGQFARVTDFGRTRFQIRTGDGRVFRAHPSLIRVVDPSSEIAIVLSGRAAA